ncbi:MAG: hypothetical protein ACK4M9_18690 [Anaerobacillus sp.]|uniref:hypothetical protein n=1 Tax=Anaerobacillus sp. TaxID=1872506 RepID=UPI00391C4204
MEINMLSAFAKKLKNNYKVTSKKCSLIAVSNRLKRYCSIQQINSEIPPLDLAKMYFYWLTTASKKIIKVNETKDSYELSFRFLKKKPLLILKLEDQDDKKAQYLVTGGLLAIQQQHGTFTFYRYKGTSVIALEHFQPKLPWWVYLVTQAPIHEFVMIRFLKKYHH